jgi:hypothetical protein
MYGNSVSQEMDLFAPDWYTLFSFHLIAGPYVKYENITLCLKGNKVNIQKDGVG